MRLANTLVLASLNREKFEEFQSIFGAYPEVKIVPVATFVRNPEGLRFAECYETYLENAVAKARLVNLGAHYPTLSDDSGLEVTALGNKPGVRSHRYAPQRPHLSQDQANVELLLSEMKSVSDRSARFVCTLALLIEGILVHATGVLEGVITEAPRGAGGFGYDPVFVPKGSHKTLAEMSAAEKNTISHRARAVHALMGEVKSRGITFAKP